MYSVRLAYGLGRGLRDAEVADLPNPDELGHCPPQVSSIGTVGSTRCW